MDAEGPAAKIPSLKAELDTKCSPISEPSLKAELDAKCSRISELEDKVSALEAENARLRKALARARDPPGVRRPKSGRFAACDVFEISDDEEWAGSLYAFSNEGRNLEEGVVAAPAPRKPAVAGEGKDEADVGEDGADVGEDAQGGGGSDEQEDCAGLEEDDVSVTPGGKRRAAARVVTSDSEDGDHGELGTGKDDADGQEEGVKTASRKRGLCGMSDSDDEDVAEGVRPSNAASRVVAAQIESGDEDDLVPIRQVLKKTRKKWEGDADDGLPEARGHSAPTTRRSAQLVRNQSKGGRASRRVNSFVETKESEWSEDDMEDDEDMDEFINDEDPSENASESSAEEPRDQSDVSDTPALNEESSPGAEESDIVADYTSVMARIGRKKKAEDWKFEGDMLAAFAEHPELRLKAVCALYRKQTQEEQMEKAALVHNGQGFNHIDARRGSHIAEFLLDGDQDGPLKKTIPELEEYDPYALGFCHKVAKNYSKQLFAIYQNKEDPYFHP